MLDGHPIKNTTDFLAAGLTGASILQIVPAIAAALSIIWMGIRVYELTTGRAFSDSALARFLTRTPPGE